MQVRRLDAAGFVRSAGEFLRAHEAEHNLMLGLSGRLVGDAHLYGADDPYFAVVEAEGRVVTAALRTPPHYLILAESEDPAGYSALAEDAHGVFPGLPGVTGPAAAVEVFVPTWSSLTGAGAHRVMSQRIYQANEVIAARPVGGRMRPVDDKDHDLALTWLEAFMREAIPAESPGAEAAAEFLERNAADSDGGLVVWDDRAPVSIAGYGSPTPRGIRIGPVYTPPARRGRGYASALAADLTRQLLSSGRDFCFLYTDLANETSNSIYQRVGYRPVADVERWAF